jgi:16S rRNA G527 N7-methylase RsmG
VRVVDLRLGPASFNLPLAMATGTRPKKPGGLLQELASGEFDWPQLASSALRAQGLPEGVIQTALAGIVVYLQEVLRWGSRVDLIAPSSLGEFLDLSLADAAVMARYELENGIARTATHLLDVGSGGGAPGIPLALLLLGGGRPCRFSFVEPRDKRVAFLRSVVGQLGLPGAEVLRTRSDQLPSRLADVAVSRATLPPPDWLSEGVRLANEVWVLVAREEAPATPPDWLGVADLSYQWPLTGRARRALNYRRG